MFLTIENVISLLTITCAAAGYIGYRCGKSDQRDAEARARVTAQFEAYRKCIRGQRNGN